MYAQGYMAGGSGRPPWWPRLESERGDTLFAGQTAVTPIARTLTIGYAPDRAAAGGLAPERGFFYRCRWPAAASVTIGGKESRVWIVDVTRLAQLAIVSMAALLVYGVWMCTRAQKER